MRLVYSIRTVATVVVIFAFVSTSSFGQGLRPNGGNQAQLDAVEQGDAEFKQRTRESCPTYIRTIDGTCTNFPNKIWGSAGTPHYSYIHQSTSTIPTGKGLPSARHISNVLSSQSSNVFNRRGLTEFVLYFAQFLDHTIVATASNTSESMPIPIPKDDPIFANFTDGELSFHRSIRGLVTNENGAERPINSLSAAIDLASVYSSDDGRIKYLRSFINGRLAVSENNMLPFNRDGLVNAPTKEATYFIAGDHRANEHPVLTSFHTLFLREHNRLCDELIEAFPSWKDERVFGMARKINIAQFQKVVYDEFLPSMMGKKIPAYTGYNEHINPSLSDVFTTAAYRIGHTMVGNVVTRRGVNMSEMEPLPVEEMFFRTVRILDGGIEQFIRGAIYQTSQEVDLLVQSSIRNHLFKNIPQEKGFDLVALNIQRGRDHAIPKYNRIRTMFGRSAARSFADITSNLAVQSKLATLYGTPGSVEAWVGLMAEDHLPDASMGPTLYQVWLNEFKRIRDGDRFFYERSRLIPTEVWLNVQRVRDLMFERDTMKQIILRNSDISKDEIRGSIWTTEGR